MRGLLDHLTVATGSLIGREHVRTQRNNQDGLALVCRDDLLVAAVTDGCSSGRYSEVGARLGAGWLAQWVPVYAERHGSVHSPAFLQAVTDGFLSYLQGVARRFHPVRDAMPATVQDYLLFTFLVVAMTPAETCVFGLGDGVVGLNGELQVLEAGEGNAPPYLAYRLVEKALMEPVGMLQPVIFAQCPTAAVDHVLIATDGAAEIDGRAGDRLPSGDPVGSLQDLARDPRYGRNPSLLQKRLTVLGDVNRWLHDDTTMVLIQRKEDMPCVC
jgi:hypothetical protein